MCQKDKLPEGRTARKGSSVVAQPIRGSLGIRSVVLLDDSEGE